MARFAACLMTSALALGLAGAAQAQQPVPMDRATTVNGVDVACAGVGASSQNNPSWNHFAVRLAFVARDGAYLGAEHVRVRDRHGEVLSVSCHAPWLMMDLRPGRYEATATLRDGRTKHVHFRVSRSRHERRILLRYDVPANQGRAEQGGYRDGPQAQSGYGQEQNRRGYDDSRYNGQGHGPAAERSRGGQYGGAGGANHAEGRESGYNGGYHNSRYDTATGSSGGNNPQGYRRAPYDHGAMRNGRSDWSSTPSDRGQNTGGQGGSGQ